MAKNFISAIWAVVGVIVLGIISPALIFKENFVMYQILISTACIGLYAAYMYFRYLELFTANNSISNTLHENTSELEENLAHQEHLNSILYEITLSLGDANTDKESMLSHILEKAIESIPDANFGSILTANPDGLFGFIACSGYDLIHLKSIRFKKEETFMWMETKGNTNLPVIIRDTSRFNQEHMAPETYKQHLDIVKVQVKSVLSAPIYIDGELYGIVNIDSLNPNAFSESDLKMARFLTTHISFILKHNQLLERAFYLSMFDKLTNIYNRTYFEDIFTDFQMKAFSHNKKFSLAIMDLNYLKRINDTYGHLLGDEALRAFADGVRKHLNATDVFARYGGDEFIALLDNVDAESAKGKFDEISTYFEDVNLECNGVMIPIQFSYGVAQAPDESMILDILVKVADERMYIHKKYLKTRNQNDPRFYAIR